MFIGFFSFLIAALILGPWIATPSIAQDKPKSEAPTTPNPRRRKVAAPQNGSAAKPMPDAAMINILIRRTLLTINDANLSNNYTVLRDLAAPVFNRPTTSRSSPGSSPACVTARSTWRRSSILIQSSCANRNSPTNGMPASYRLRSNATAAGELRHAVRRRHRRLAALRGRGQHIARKGGGRGSACLLGDARSGQRSGAGAALNKK